MTYRLQQWPERHRTLLGVIFLLVIATVLFGMMRLHPTWVAYDEARSDHARVEKSWKSRSGRVIRTHAQAA